MLLKSLFFAESEVEMEIRNTMLYRRFRYVKKRHKVRVYTYYRLIATIILFIIITKYAGKTILPYMNDVSENRVKSVINILINDTVQKTFSGKESYDELVSINKNGKGEIEAITTNTSKVNILSSKIAIEIQKKLNSQNRVFVNVPLGSLLGKTILYNSGPDIYLTVKQNGSIETDFISEFSEAGINQTKHRILLLIKTNVMVKTAFIKNSYSIVTTVPVAETIIVGKVPTIYYRDMEQ